MNENESKKESNYKHEYIICNVANEEIFWKQCKALEKYIPNLIKLQLLHDVDDSKVQIYQLNGQELSVHNSYYLNSVYIKSKFDIDSFFE